MTTDLVPAANLDALDALDDTAREMAVTRMLTEARSWLAHAVEATGPAEIATFKAQMATVAEATKQLGLSKEIQFDAQEMVRRAERGVSLAVREAQQRGDIARPHEGTGPRSDYVRGGQVVHVDPLPNTKKMSAGEFYSNGQQWSDSHSMADATDEEFDEALAKAKGEGNLSRANVVRKIKSEAGPTTRDQRADLIANLADQGYSSRQMATKVGVRDDRVREIARDYSIDIPADRIIGRSRRVDSTDVVRNIVIGYENALAGDSAINWSDVDPSEAEEWVSSLTESIRNASDFRKKIKELTRD